LEGVVLSREILRECMKLRKTIERERWRSKEQKKVVLKKYAELVNLLV
jgi:hypothetical protein